MNVIIMYVFLITGVWETYNFGADVIMGEVKTLDDCGREADQLMIRRGDISSWACVISGDPQRIILPPYDWPRYQFRQRERCDVKCMMEESDARRRI